MLFLEKQLNLAYGCHGHKGHLNKKDFLSNRSRSSGRDAQEMATIE